MKVAAFDLGSNTFLMLVAEVVDGQIVEVLKDELTVTRLGQGVHDSREFHPQALRRAEECLTRYRKMADDLGVDKFVVAATSAARDVKNGDALLAIGEKLNLPIQIIPGQLEAEVTFVGSTVGSTFESGELDNLAVIDVGGGSTEIIGWGASGKIVGCSLDVGSVRLTEMFISEHPIPKQQVEKLCDYIDQQLLKAKSKFPSGQIEKVIAVAGTPTTLASVAQAKEFSEQAVNGYRLTVNSMNGWAEKLADMSVAERQNLVGMDPKRADVIVAGTHILRMATESLGAKEAVVSTRGVRYGLALMHDRL